MLDLKYFNEDEFICTCGCGCGKENMDNVLLGMLDRARDLAGVSFNITSGYRCEKHNKDIGGVKDSAHCTGKAVDIACQSSRIRCKMLKALLTVGFTRIGIAQKFIHVDVDERKDSNVVWVYS